MMHGKQMFVKQELLLVVKMQMFNEANAILARRIPGNIGAAVAFMKAMRKRREVYIHAASSWSSPRCGRLLRRG